MFCQTIKGDQRSNSHFGEITRECFFRFVLILERNPCLPEFFNLRNSKTTEISENGEITKVKFRA